MRKGTVMVLLFLAYLIIYTGKTTLIGLMLLNLSDVMKKKQLTKMRNAEMVGDSGYQMKKTYIIPKAFGFIFMLPFILFIFRFLAPMFP